MSNKSPRGGILMPCTSHQFRVHLYQSLTTSDSYIDFMQQIVSVEYNLKQKTITLVARDDCEGHATNHINKFATLRDSWTLAIGALGNAGIDSHVLHAKRFNECTLVDHRSRFSYADAKAVEHTLTISYRSLDLVTDDRVVVSAS